MSIHSIYVAFFFGFFVALTKMLMPRPAKTMPAPIHCPMSSGVASSTTLIRTEKNLRVVVMVVSARLPNVLMVN